MADLTTLQGWLIEAQFALHKLQTGQQVVEVSHADMHTKYAVGDVGKLRAYIDDLNAQIVAAGGTRDGLARKAIVIDLPGTAPIRRRWCN